ncbi:MAG: amidohydrolase [Verrucomicrobiales bacterium]|nr:amidohydrolase [Verrucomicrobiales bacterium]
MKNLTVAAAPLAAFALSAFAQDSDKPVSLKPKNAHREMISNWMDTEIDGLVQAYKEFHSKPELSLQEFKTAAALGKAWKAAGFEVTPGVGGTGVVGVFKNGDGPTLLIRGDMDALPVLEETGLPYASQVRVKNRDGTDVGAMHACGHDVHITMLYGIAPLLVELKHQWKGTLVLIGQPAEEVGKGARMMIEDGLFEKFPKPDFCLALHVKNDLPINSVGYTSGWAFANVDSVDITIYGKGGHGAAPHTTVDPIVTAAHVITGLQTLVSRKLNPIDPGVVTVGSIRGGTKHNIIPDEVKLQLTVRSYTDEVRKQLLDGIRELTTATCKTFKCPKDPLVEVKDEFTPAAYNDPELTEAAMELFGELYGKDNVFELEPTMGGEDFGRFARHLNVPGLQYRIGSIPRERWEASKKPGAKPLPSLHSPLYYPEAKPTVRIAVESMANLAFSILQP